jgi:hypothetical protein
MERRLTVFGILYVSLVISGQAQDYERFAPQQVPQDSVEVEVISDIPEAVGPEEVLVEALEGVVLLRSSTEVRMEGLSFRGLKMDGFDLLQARLLRRWSSPILVSR